MSNRKCKVCESEESAELSMFECSQCGEYYCGRHQVVGSDAEDGSCLECYVKRDNITGVYKECDKCGSKLEFLESKKSGRCKHCRTIKEHELTKIDDIRGGMAQVQWTAWTKKTGWILCTIDTMKLTLEMIEKGDYKKL